LASLQQQVDNSEKLYLLHGRREPQKEKPPMQITLHMRHYLSMITVPEHREAVTSILLSTHQLALEKLRYADHADPSLPRDQRLCRFCRAVVESPEHALFECQASTEVVQFRAVFMDNFLRTMPKWRDQWANCTSVQLLKALIYERVTIKLFGKYVYEVLRIFYEVPVYRGGRQTLGVGS
ncbi:hypothetical protein FB45DRAFT_754785, partial [Roridomyces roridus]